MFPDAEWGRGGRLLTWFWDPSPTCWLGFRGRPPPGVVISDSRCWFPWLPGVCCSSEGWRGCFKDCLDLCPRGERWESLCWGRMWLWLLNSVCCSILLGFLLGGMMAGVWSIFTNPFPGVWKLLPLDPLVPVEQMVMQWRRENSIQIVKYSWIPTTGSFDGNKKDCSEVCFNYLHFDKWGLSYWG